VISTDLTQGRDRRRDDVNTELKFEFFKVWNFAAVGATSPEWLVFVELVNY
jgi:hypothetical protein